MDWETTSTILSRLHCFDDDRAWGRLSAGLRTPIVRFACKMGLDGGDADDVAQESLLVFARRYKRGDYDRAKGRLSSWLFGISFRQVLKVRTQLRRRETQWSPECQGHTVDLQEDPAEKNWREEWEQWMLQQCVGQVRLEFEPTTIRAFEAVVHAQRSPAEAASELGITVRATYGAKHRVLKRLRELWVAAEKP